MNGDLIRLFRNKINGNNGFMLHIYRQNEGKNLWNCICACMDWIEVSNNSLIDLNIEDSNINAKSMKAFSFLSSVDIIIEATIQLHRVIVDNNSEPFSDEKTIFSNQQGYKNDKQFFKHIRAIFGAHPVNLKGIDNVKWFASWPTDHVYREYDLAVILYPSDPVMNSQEFGIKFKDIWAIADKYYSYLEVLINEVDRMYDEYCAEMRAVPIPYSESKFELIEILKLESKQRLNNDYYRSIIDDLKLYYTAYSGMDNYDEKIKSFVLKLDDLLNEIYSNLQNMIFSDLKNDYVIYPDWPQEINYCLQKVVESLKNEGFDNMFGYHIEKITSFLEGVIDIRKANGDNEILLYIYTGLYYLNID